MSANLVFINIDWQAIRMNRRRNTNMITIANTMEGVVCNMRPTLICMCEVGAAKLPLNGSEMEHTTMERT